jgi:hypothetical protein
MLRSINVLAQFSMAGFEVTLHGRFWVTAEGQAGFAGNWQRKEVADVLYGS